MLLLKSRIYLDFAFFILLLCSTSSFVRFLFSRTIFMNEWRNFFYFIPREMSVQQWFLHKMVATHRYYLNVRPISFISFIYFFFFLPFVCCKLQCAVHRASTYRTTLNVNITDNYHMLLLRNRQPATNKNSFDWALQHIEIFINVSNFRHHYSPHKQTNKQIEKKRQNGEIIKSTSSFQACIRFSMRKY